MLIYNPKEHIAISFSPRVASTSIRNYARKNGWIEYMPNDIERLKINKAYFIVRDPIERFHSQVQQYIKRWADAKHHEYHIHWHKTLPELKKHINSTFTWYNIDQTHFKKQNDVKNQYPTLDFELIKLESIWRVLPKMSNRDNISNEWILEQCKMFTEEHLKQVKLLYKEDFELYNKAL